MILDIIIPIYNNEKQLVNCYNKIQEEFKNIKHNLIFVNDYSNDKSLNILKNIYKHDEESTKIISLSKVHGKDIAIYAGLEASKHELVCVYDIDDQINPATVKKMYDYIIEHNNYDQISLRSTNNKETSFLKLFNKLFNLDIDNNIPYTRIITKSVKDAILELTKYHNFSKYSFKLVGFSNYTFKCDIKYIKKYDYKKVLQYSDNPFKPLKLFSISIFIVSLIYLLLVILKVININGNILLFVLLLIICGELLLKNFINNNLITRNLTYYLVKEKIGFDENFL